jgi:hypothetical protein
MEYYLYHIIYNTVYKNPGITINQLVWLISTSDLDFDECIIRKHIYNLKHGSPLLPKCLKFYTIPKEKTKKGYDVEHLRCMNTAVHHFLNEQQKIEGYIIPELTFKRV